MWNLELHLKLRNIGSYNDVCKLYLDVMTWSGQIDEQLIVIDKIGSKIIFTIPFWHWEKTVVGWSFPFVFKLRNFYMNIIMVLKKQCDQKLNKQM